MSTETWHVGDISVTRVVEKPLVRPLPAVLPGASNVLAEGHPWLRPDFLTEDGEGIFSVHSYIVRVDGQVILVDTGYGNGKVRRVFAAGHDLHTDFLERLTAAGAGPDDVDVVVATHLHFDHVGWNTRLIESRWQPTFARARHLMSALDLAYWSGLQADEGTPEADHAQVFADSVVPLLDAGLVEPVALDDGHEVAPGVQLVATPGHSPGHLCVRLQSQGDEAWILGDSAHHPLQVAHPELAAAGDVDPDRARRTREDLWERFTDRPITVLGSHWPGDPVRIVSDGDTRRTLPAT